MRILAVRLRNLNSLTGSWAIDFTAPEYSASGIFAITGPTGAGKSTILDAICLALFARTPRLGRISQGSNEIMSRRAGDCFAEVEFATRQGRYRCHWSQHRARRSPGGELQSPRHEIVAAENGKVLESRSREVARLVEQMTGMDYDRFTRSMLLAQGDFAAFLEAAADQRAPILEQITGTGIYSRISMAVHQRTSEERGKIALLQEAMGRATLLDEFVEQELAATINQGLAAATDLQQRLNLLAQDVHRLEAIASLKAQLETTGRMQAELNRRREQAQTDLLRLDRGRRAQALLGEYTLWSQSQERIVTLRAKETILRSELTRHHEAHRQITVEHARACEEARKAVELRQRENELMTAVRALDLRIHEKKQAMAQRDTVRRQSERERDQAQRQRQELERQLATIAVQEEQTTVFFRDHGGDSLLVEQLAGFRQQLQHLCVRESEVQRLVHALQAQQRVRVEAEQQHARVDQEFVQATDELAALRQRRQEVETERTRLLAGEEPALWRRRLEEETQRHHQLHQVADLLSRRAQFDKELTRLTQVVEQQRTSERQFADELRILEERQQLQRQLVEQCERNQSLSLRIRSLAEERKHLRPGTACPLCGATKHPWAEAEPEVDTAVEEPLIQARTVLDQGQAAIARARERLAVLAKDIEHLQATMAKEHHQRAELTAQLTPLMAGFGEESEVTRLLTQLTEPDGGHLETLRRRVGEIDRIEDQRHIVQIRTEQATARHAETHQRMQAARHDFVTAATEERRLESQLRAVQAGIEEDRAVLLGQLQPLGIDHCAPGQADQLLGSLEARLQAWKDQRQRSEQLAQLRSERQSELDKLDLLLTTIGNTLAQQEEELAALRREESLLRVERRERYGERDPDVEEQRLRIVVERTAAREEALGSRVVAVDKEVHGLSEQIRLGEEEGAHLLAQGQAQQTRLLSLLPAAGFTALDDFRAALLPPEALAQLDSLGQELDREQTELAARRAEQSAALAREMEQQRDGRGREELLAVQAELDRELAAVQQHIGAARERLTVNEQHKRQFEVQRQALVVQQRELDRWELLHQLIGSADGKKFRVFAQGLTFEVMISHANRQLRKMSDRYILLHDPMEPLGLQVVDNYQAGEIRSTRNLSGGESFLVSLALSLGLSAMASHNVRVDSLFLDEGFGTLDEEALDTALQTLAELRQDGKLIGVISHVPMLRDRIGVRIQVVPGANGTSRLLGPGCAQLF